MGAPLDATAQADLVRSGEVRRMRLCARFGLVVAVTVVMHGTSYASVVSVTTPEEYEDAPVLGGKLHYTALTGESNQLRVEQAADGDGLIFTDPGVERIFEDEDACEALGAQQVLCRPDPYEDVYDLEILLGDGADRALVLSTDLDPDPGGFLPLELYGGRGPDLLRTRVKSAKLFGQAGDDRISAMKGRTRDRDNRVSCGEGRDRAFVDGTFSADRRDCETVRVRSAFR
jgi:hypothetical protein